MRRFRFWGPASGALILACLIVSKVWPENPQTTKALNPAPWDWSTTVAQGPPAPVVLAPVQPPSSTGLNYAIYNLSELGDDPEFANWVAQLITDVIQPGTWSQDPGVGKRSLRYFAPSKILVVYHTPAVQTEVSNLLKNLQRTLPSAKGKAGGNAGSSSPREPALIPARHEVPNLLKPPSSETGHSSSYPVPSQSKQPKHLFHFIIRYEGDGIIDQNVVEFCKAYGLSQAKQEDAPKSQEKTSTVSPASSN